MVYTRRNIYGPLNSRSSVPTKSVSIRKIKEGTTEDSALTIDSSSKPSQKKRFTPPDLS